MKNQAFTLIELLVVVLIIGILAAIAVPYYQESVEKSIMQEAIINLKNIAQAHDIFILQNNKKLSPYEIDKLDISIPGSTNSAYGPNRISTKYFLYSPSASAGPGVIIFKATAHRLPIKNKESYYYIAIDDDNNLSCRGVNNNTTSTQQKLCNQINRDGHL